MRAVAAPFPLLRSKRDSDDDRIQIDVPRGGHEVPFGQDRAVREAILEEVSEVIVLAVPPTRVFARKLLHSRGKVGVRDLNEQVRVSRHQAVPEHLPPVLPRNAFEQLEVDAAIVIVEEDPTAVVAPRRDVIDPTRFHLSRRSRHPRHAMHRRCLLGPSAARFSKVVAPLYPCLTPGHV